MKRRPPLLRFVANRAPPAAMFYWSVVSVAVFAWFGFRVFLRCWFLDFGSSGNLFPPLRWSLPWRMLYTAWTTTEYAPGYSDRGFLQIEIGMDENEVEKRLGPPLSVYAVPGGRHGTRNSGAASAPLTGWQYSRSPDSSDYRVRCVLFRDGRVCKVVSEYYFD